MQRVGLMGGSFNPIHCGHLNMARAALNAGAAGRVLILPSGNPPHKRAGLADKMDRLAMAELAIADQPGMEICREEIDREGVIYTVDTLDILAERMPDAKLIYLIGADTLAVLHTWRRIDEVIRKCAFQVAMRPGEDEAQIQAAAESWRSRGAQIDFLPSPLMEISSTEIRRRLEQGLALDGLVPAAVEDYIRRHQLYASDGDDNR